MSQSLEPKQKNEKNRELLGKLVKRGITELKPTLSKVGVHYVDVEENLSDVSPTQVMTILKNLEKKGAVEADVLDRVLTCSDCGSPEVYSKYACPRCHSFNVEYTELMEHMKCGYIGSKDKFTEGSSLVCPGCKTLINENGSSKVSDLYPEQTKCRTIGNCYLCEKCGYRFDAPEIVHFCQQCKRNFTPREGNYVKIYKYKITDKTLDEFGKDSSVLETISSVLQKNGYKVRLQTSLLGASGVKHLFDIVAEKNNTRLAIDLSTVGDTKDVVSLMGKKMDTNPTEAILIDLSKDGDFSSLGQVYNIKTLKATDEKKLEIGLTGMLAGLDLPESEQKTKSKEKPQNKGGKSKRT